MKICFLSDINSSHTHKWLNFFLEKGYELHVISLRKGTFEGVTVHSLDIDESVAKSNTILNKLSYMKKIKEVRALVREIKPDILHAHYASSYGLLGSLTNYHPYVISVWGSDVYDFPKSSLVCKNVLKYNLKKADFILSTSHVMKKETELYTNKHIDVTPFGVNIDLFKPADNPIRSDDIIIGTVKTLEDKYGIEYLVRAFGVVCNDLNDYSLKLRIAGTGSQEVFLKGLCKELKIEDKVEFLGFINQTRVIEEFKNLDIAVFPSTLDSESFGVAAVEAEACGKPVIVSDCDGLMESTKPNETSLVVKKRDYIDLADKLKILIQDESLRKEMGVKARKYVVDNYNLTDNFNCVDNLYKDILNKKY